MQYIQVFYEKVSTIWGIKKQLNLLNHFDYLSFDTETRSLYTSIDRKEALDYLDNEDTVKTHENIKTARMISNSSGLSFPSLVQVTHFIFGISENFSYIFITDSPEKEMLIWNWLKDYKGLLLIHNTLFDLKLMFHRIRTFPENYLDTSLKVKSLLNHVDVWKAKTSLKDLMRAYYDPKWALVDDYEPESLYDPDFLVYCSIDGAATVKLYHMLNEQTGV